MQIERSPGVTYEDIGGLGSQIQEVIEAIQDPLTDPAQFKEVGIEPPSGVLLHGPPGTGKTMLAKAVANQTDATFIKMAGSELVQKFIGEGARLVRDLFELAKTSGDAEVQRTMMQLLSEMDGFEDRGNIRIIAATNRFDMLDRALLRPGRFDRLIEVPAPDWDGRKAILEIHTKDMNLDDDIDMTALASETEGFTGAEISSLATEAGMFAIRDSRAEVTMADFRDALEKVSEEDDTTGTPIAFA